MKWYTDYLAWVLAIGGALVLFQLYVVDMNVAKMKDKSGYTMGDKSR